LASVELRDIQKSYGPHAVVHDVFLEIEDGEFVALVGPSGCGKSTLLRMIAGLETISGGDLLIGGERMNAVAPKSRDIAMVFQNYALYPHMTVAENMSFALRIQGRPKQEIASKVRAAAEIIGLTPYLGRMPRQLSGGQRQRVAIGRAIVRDPKVFLFDEPLSNLDAKLRVQMRTEIKGLHQRLKTTTVYVTHDQVEAMTMADKIVVMNGGVVEQVGAPLDLYDRPANVFVAGFIGSPAMNLIQGKLVADRFIADASASCSLPVHGHLAGKAVGEVIYGIRPEHFLLAEEGEGGLAATVQLIEPTGAETQVLMDIAGVTLTGVFRERIAARPGQSIFLKPDLTKVHVFDRRTNSRIAPG
jgi:multiple sugar transport system ATP-binding protein